MLKIFLAVFILFNCNKINSAPFDTGMITLTQPNDVTFTGRIWGDEFFWWAETESGYRFVHSGDGWYYYATLDEDGEFTKTVYKVGIDSPPAGSYQLERTRARIDEINQQIERFNEQIELNRQWFAEKQAEAQGQAVTLKVGIILIEFQDVKHFEDENYRPFGYTTADFDSMIFSYNYWNDPQRHPEEEEIFGSFRDYWGQMSMSKLKITGKVVNPDNDEDGVPDWLEADHTRAYYADTCAAWSDSLALEAIQKALDSGYVSNTPGDSNYYDKYAIVYAREAISLGALKVHAEFIDGKFHFLAERSGFELYGPLKAFTHIGIYAHEFAHTIGFLDEYSSETPGQTDIFNFGLMDVGIYNGPDRKAACPATLSSLNRIERGWISSIPLLQDTSDFIVQYSYADPNVYRIDPIGTTGDEHYLIESRGRDGFDLYIPSDPADTVNQPGRLLIWHANVNRILSYDYSTFKDHMILKAADNSNNYGTQLTDFFPSTFNPGYQDFNDTTIPASTLGYFANTPTYIDNERPAHFAINGIYKLENGNTLIDEINLNHAIIKNNISGGWQSVSIGAILSDYSASSIFPTAIGQIYAYVPGQGYVVRTTLENGPGYWVKFGSSQSLIHAGLISDSLTIHVASGWNLIGSISDKVPKLNICTEPSGLITSMYYYDGGYHYLTNSDSLKPGRGYWLNANSDGTVLLLRNFQCPENEGMELSGFDKFMITDSDGRTQDLYVANVDIDTALSEFDRSLPPPIPEIDFDARFNYGEFIKAVSVDSGEVDLEIDVQTNAYPITLTWELNPENGIEYSFISDSGLGKISSLNNLNKNIKIDKNSNGKIKLFGKVGNPFSSNLPKKYELYQNFPNPFNPVTTIKYNIVKAQAVKLAVYDILGREVAILVNDQQQAGSYEVSWDASGFASGIYFYNLTSGNFMATKKLILLK